MTKKRICDIMNMVIKMIKQNQELSMDVKEYLKEQSKKIQNKFSELSLPLLEQRLENVTYETINDKISNKSLRYQYQENKLQLNEKAIQEEKNLPYEVTKAILDMGTLNEKDPNQMLFAFHSGMTSILANNFAGNEEERDLTNEMLTNCLAKLMGDVKALQVYEQNDPSLYLTYLEEAGLSLETTKKITDMMNYEYQVQNRGEQSRLSEIVSLLMQTDLSKKPEQARDCFESLILDGEILNQERNFGNLEVLETMRLDCLKQIQEQKREVAML